MASGILSIDLGAVVANWQALDRVSGPGTRTGAVVKANAYGLGADRISRALAEAGARCFFVAQAEEGVLVRKALGNGPQICVFSGHMPGDTPLIRDHDLTPMLNSVEQLTRHFEALPDRPFGIQLDTGMNRLGMERAEWAAVAEIAISRRPVLLMSHLACADEPDHPMNAQQLAEFHELTDGTGLPRSLSATGGILLGPAYHFDLTRPGVGLYGGLPYAEARQALRLSLPVVQTRPLAPGECAGYGCAWVAARPSVIATVSGGYADGLHRALGNRTRLWAGETPCPLVGRVSMDLMTVDVTDLPEVPEYLDILGPHQGVDALAEDAGTIAYEVLTSLGPRYTRSYDINRG